MAAAPDPEPLTTGAAKKAIRAALQSGKIEFSGHAQREMKKDDLQTTDCVNVLRGGVVEPPELADGTWRYRVSTPRICVVVALPMAAKIRVVTVWRKMA